jgi:hypothetical protein
MAEVKAQAHVSKPSLTGVLKIAGQGRLAEQFITAGKEFHDSMARCVFRDEAQKNAVVIYKSHLDMFEMTDEESDLVNWLNGTTAVGGYNRSAAIMDDTGQFTPSGLGIKDTKEHEKAIKELREDRMKYAEAGRRD